MSSAYRDIEVSKELRQCDVTKLGRENTMISIEYRFRSHDDQDIVRQINFSLKPEGFLASMEEFDKVARGGWGPNRRLPVPPNTIERTKMVFSNNPYYLQAFEFYQSNRSKNRIQEIQNSNANTNSVAIGEAINDAEADAANEEEQVKREEAYASAISDPDYDNVKKSERLTPITVPNALRKDPGRYCVYGIIETVKNPFKLITEVGFTCTNRKCQSYNNPKWQIIDTPIFSVDDMPIAFKAERDKTGKIKKTGQQRYLEFLRCPDCNHNRQVRPRYEHFDNAKIIELKKLERITKVSTAIANNTLNLERLTVPCNG